MRLMQARLPSWPKPCLVNLDKICYTIKLLPQGRKKCGGGEFHYKVRIFGKLHDIDATGNVFRDLPVLSIQKGHDGASPGGLSNKHLLAYFLARCKMDEFVGSIGSEG